ncbi:MAG TPA: GTP 3',8-cyclase MoaA [Kiritimatiellia bacterium]|nr:GTP 3',8-cyclase MoaA [Kiritimatiellia bacterium]HMO97824.1 GTP 3',8-cyclase MoaA [Kiritimatiellia bacterium]HMP96429.1 GTP 3',8-cyclase MoaA [Kiritimatiellia bacterium]
MALDQYGRSINYLRISLTDQCNLRCRYCMTETMTFQPPEALMQNDEVIRLARIFTELGFRKFRLTGGEPTLRHELVPLVRALAGIPGVRDISMTTNGVLLKHLAKPLREAGLHRLNVSIDTLDPARFKLITRWGNFQDVWNGLMIAEDLGFPIKINAVPVRGLNDNEDVIALARLTLAHAWQVRFIEMMPFGVTSEFQKDRVVTQAELMAAIQNALGALHVQRDGQLDGEARCYRLDHAPGEIGFISSVSQPFCSGCNRARLTADGVLRLCLLRDKELPLLPLLRGGANDLEMKQIIESAIWFKPWGHGLAEHVIPRNRLMSEIGG